LLVARARTRVSAITPVASAASDALARTLVDSGRRRIAFLGLAKNVGKTTALVATLASLHRRGVAVGATSAGRDGEAFDAITGEPKPRFRIARGQLVASATSTFASASFPSAEIATLDFPTRFGPIMLRRADGDGEIEIIGPSTVSQLAKTAAALEAAGADVVLLDGAIGRRAFACGRLADGIVLAVGMAAGESLDGVLAATRGALELIRLGTAPAGAPVRTVEGALTDATLRDLAPREGETLLARDFTAIFLSPDRRRALRESGVSLAVREPARLLAVTVNPTAPARPPFPPDRFFRAVVEVVEEAGPAPVFDLVADFR
jgi:hypothetical protein